mgnify:CR=1 FL=1|jgi:Holliday junction resolvase RusA-like endonuclease|tara:strand:- start:1237 stop:1746 length:510 start_codon:yes stop_codon:yes gene_type:complete
MNVASMTLTELQCKEFRSTSFTVQGQPYSKANSRKLVTIGGKPRFIKSAKARSYVTDFQAQCPKLDPFLEGDLEVWITVFYQSRRPDLDCSILFDAAQGYLYKNDRQIKHQHLFWRLDRENPRSEIFIREIEIKNPHQSPDWWGPKNQRGTGGGISDQTNLKDDYKENT